jgi:hypothetical protein
MHSIDLHLGGMKDCFGKEPIDYSYFCFYYVRRIDFYILLMLFCLTNLLILILLLPLISLVLVLVLLI